MFELEQLNIEIIKQYLMKLINKGLSSSIVQSIKNVLKAIYITYEDQYGLNHIDFSLVKIEQDKKENEYLTDKQFNQLHQYCMKEKNDICLSILLAMDTGMMIGEMCALKVSDIDLDKQLIHISISKRTQRIKNDEEGSKTVYDIYEVEWTILRDITIPKELFFYLQEYLDYVGVQSMKQSLPENYKSSDEEKKKQINKL